ncbi:MAG: DUF4468 domain-containing protein [Bacteroidota bacterium]
MKKVLFVVPSFFILLIIHGCGSIYGTKTSADLPPVAKVIPVENVSQNKLYVRANNWMVGAFTDAKSVVQFSDKESGTITGKYYLSPITASTQYGAGTDAYAIINIQVKDGASKITITPEVFDYMKGNMYTVYDEDFAKEKMSALVYSFETAIQLEDKSDW